jgi:VCBS repeat-containing protein
VTFTATVTPLSGSGNPTGQVHFFDGSTQIGTDNLSGGTASISKSDLSGGGHSITAVYDGSSAFAGSTSAVLTQTVNNSPPTADDDATSTSEDTPHTVPAPGVLQGDSDPNGDALTAVNPSTPAHGTVSLNANGSFTYTPAADFNGTDSFTYQASDGSLTSNTATVTVTVTAVNDAPTAADDGPYSVAQDTPTSLAGLLTNDSDVEGSALSAAKASNPSNGSVTVNPDGSFDYTPNPGFTGQDTFTYVANDGALDSAPATVTIDVQ